MSKYSKQNQNTNNNSNSNNNNNNNSNNENKNSIECKKLLTEEINKEIQQLAYEDLEKMKKKNVDSQQKYTTESENNFNAFRNIVVEMRKYIPEYANTIISSKLDNKMRQYGEDMLKGANTYFSKLNQMIQSKNVSILINDFTKNRFNEVKQKIDRSKQDIDQFNKAGCCGSGTIKQKLSIEIPENFYVSLHFLEYLAITQVFPQKVEYPYLEPDFDGLQRKVKSLIDKYFPTDTEVQFVDRTIYVDKPIIETKTEYVNVYIEGKNEEDFLIKGHEHVYGIGMPQQIKKGLDFYLIEDKKSNVKAYNSLGQVYLEGKVVEQDLKKAYNYYLKSCEKHDAEGRYRMAQFYERGYINQITHENISQDDLIKKAVEMYKQAASQKHYDAMIDLGFIYENGIRDSRGNYIEIQNLTQAKTFYESVDLENCPRACNNLGTLALKQNNTKSALMYFQRADAMGYPSGTMNLGICYLKGIGIKSDINKAMDLLKRAAKKGNQESKLQYCYYLLQQASDENNEQDYFQAATYLREILTIDANNSEALLYLGFLHELGLGVVTDYKTSLKYYFQSAKSNNDKALTKLGDIYFSGTLLSRDVEKAIEYYNKAASYGNTTAMINLGAIFEEGYDGQEPNYEKAYEYYLQAANGGSAEAWTHIGLMIEMGRKKDCQASESYQAYIRASELGNLNSLQILKDKVDILNNYDVNIEFKNDQDEEQFRILKQNQLNILQSHRQVSEIQLANKLKSSRIQETYDTPTAAGLNYQNWENQNLNNNRK